MNNWEAEYYEPLVRSAQDYYAFGQVMPGRSENGPEYRYGFNGKEKDGELGLLTHYDYGFRIYNPGIGKFLSVDPLTGKYPWLTPYQFANNKAIMSIDIDGLEDLQIVDWQSSQDNHAVIKIESHPTIYEQIQFDVTFGEGRADGGLAGLNPINWLGEYLKNQVTEKGQPLFYNFHLPDGSEFFVYHKDVQIVDTRKTFYQRAYEAGWQDGFDESSAVMQSVLLEAVGVVALSGITQFNVARVKSGSIPQTINGQPVARISVTNVSTPPAENIPLGPIRATTSRLNLKTGKVSRRGQFTERGSLELDPSTPVFQDFTLLRPDEILLDLQPGANSLRPISPLGTQSLGSTGGKIGIITIGGAIIFNKWKEGAEEAKKATPKQEKNSYEHPKIKQKTD